MTTDDEQASLRQALLRQNTLALALGIAAAKSLAQNRILLLIAAVVAVRTGRRWQVSASTSLRRNLQALRNI